MSDHKWDILYVVYEEDRGCGISILGVFSDPVEAMEARNASSHCFMDVSYYNKLEDAT